MEVILAALIQNCTNQRPTKQGIIEIIKSVGGNIEEKEIEEFLNKLGDKNVDDVVKDGIEKMGSLQAAAAPVAVPVVEVKEEKEEVPKDNAEEIDLFDGLF